jgi:hypothetical protein
MYKKRKLNNYRNIDDEKRDALTNVDGEKTPVRQMT